MGGGGLVNDTTPELREADPETGWEAAKKHFCVSDFGYHLRTHFYVCIQEIKHVGDLMYFYEHIQSKKFKSNLKKYLYFDKFK